MTNKRSLFVSGTFLAIFVAMWFAGSAIAAGQSEFQVYSFPDPTPTSAAGCEPRGNLVADSAGNLYGTTSQCGVGAGTAFMLTRPVPPLTQWIETTLYEFTGDTKTSGDVGFPESGMVFDAAGNLYGVARGGTNGFGGVFKLSPPATEGGQWTESVLYSFKGGLTDGALVDISYSPNGATVGVVLDSAGNLYGVTPFGGSAIQNGYCQYGCGVAYQLTPPAVPGGAWTETVLHSFKARQGAIGPVGAPIFDSKGSLYGATWGERLQFDSVPASVYRLIPPAVTGGSWTYKLLYAFSGFDLPESGLTLHNQGRLYGTLTVGGVNSAGAVFELVPPAGAGGSWTENILHSFGNGTDGAQPLANVIFDKAGNLFSTTWVGGTGETYFDCESRGCGTVFELSPPTSVGGDWTETILHSFDFPDSRTDGSQPISGVILWKNGVLFGTTQSAGKKGAGMVYGVVP